jgi:rsbT co-antagonist protein RsbR
MSEADRIERLLEVIGRALAEDFSMAIEPGEDFDALQPLETAVGVLVAELAETKRRNQEQILEIHSKNREITDRQASALRELSAPILMVWDGILALPLVGAVDVDRGQALLESVLQRVVEERARYVIIDVTGARDLNASTAQYLLRAGRAVRLLGSRFCLTGVSAEIARTLAELGLDLNEIRTTRRLSDALKTAFGEMKIPIAGSKRRE